MLTGCIAEQSRGQAEEEGSVNSVDRRPGVLETVSGGEEQCVSHDRFSLNTMRSEASQTRQASELVSPEAPVIFSSSHFQRSGLQLHASGSHTKPKSVLLVSCPATLCHGHPHSVQGKPDCHHGMAAMMVQACDARLPQLQTLTVNSVCDAAHVSHVWGQR